MLFDYRTLRAYAPFVYVASVIGLIAVISPLGVTINGAQAWILLPGGFSIQPSEFMKVALCVGLAMLLAERRDGETEPQLPDVGFALLIAAVPIGLVMLQPDLGTAVVMGMIVLGILAVAGTRLSWLAVLLVVGVVGAFAAVQVGVLDEYQIDRLLAFANPELDPQGVGYNTNQARIAVGSGGLLGAGLFQGTQTAGEFVPEQQTDFIFTVVGEELGFVGSACDPAALRRAALACAADRHAGRGPVRHARGDRHRLLVHLPDVREHRDGDRDHAGDRRPAAVRLVRRHQHVRQLDGDRPAGERPPAPRPALSPEALAAVRRDCQLGSGWTSGRVRWDRRRPSEVLVMSAARSSRSFRGSSRCCRWCRSRSSTSAAS